MDAVRRTTAVNLKDPQLRGHRDAAVIENARFLLEQGEHIDRVARRLGITVSALEKMTSRKAPSG